MWKVIEIVQYALYDGGDYYGESFDNAEDARDRARELEGNDEDYVEQCTVNLDKDCSKCGICD